VEFLLFAAWLMLAAYFAYRAARRLCIALLLLVVDLLILLLRAIAAVLRIPLPSTRASS
jgi:hypothetical protein